jgi:adenine/guanine phosphoribosyltransferase-like PRPP-binding protein
MCALMAALEDAGAEVVDACVVIRRGTPKVTCDYKTLVEIEVGEDGVHVVDPPR